MLSTSVWRGHAAHFLVFGVPILALAAAVGWQEIRARLQETSARTDVDEPVQASELGAYGLVIAGAGLAVAAGLHAAVISEHFRESTLYGSFFTILAIAQCWLAVVVLRRPGKPVVRCVAWSSVWIVALWIVTRTTGLPIGPEPWQPEAFGAFDIASSAAEIVTIAGCMTYLWSIKPRRQLWAHRVTGLTP
jgi:hypothetical protein